MDVRRIVTGLNDEGQSAVWIDGPATNAVSRRQALELLKMQVEGGTAPAISVAV
jgi:hypothetical protein